MSAVRTAQQGLILLSGLSLVLAPLVYLGWLASQAGPAGLGQALVDARAGELFVGVLGLGLGTAVWGALLAVPLAWLVTRSDVPARHVVQWFAPLPLAIPPYVGAIVYVGLLGPGGSLHSALAAWRRLQLAEVSFPDLIYGTGGAIFVLGLFTYPYQFLLLRGALLRSNPALEEAARSLGYGPWRTLWSVSMPLLKPALLGGFLLSFGYALVDFGVVSLLRTRTFTTVVYTYLLAGFDLSAAASLSLVLVGLVWLMLLAQHRALGQARFVQVVGGARAARLVRLGRWRWPALVYTAVVLFLALLCPLIVLSAQLGQMNSISAALAFIAVQRTFLANSLLAAFSGASAVIVVGTLVAWLHGRLRVAELLAGLLQAGYGIPGTVLGLALVGLFLRAAPWLYGTVAVLVVAYLLLFTAPAHQAVKAALSQVHPSLEEAARGLGRGPVGAFRQVTLPLIWPGILGGWLLAFVLSIRELAATLILRPPGFDTLPVRLWIHTMDVGPDPRAAAVALLLVATSALVWLGVLLVRPRGLPLTPS